MITASNIQSDKLERLQRVLFVQQFDERPLVFFMFEEMPEHKFCLVDGKYIVSRESAVAYFFTHFFQSISCAKVAERINSESMEKCNLISSGKPESFGFYQFEYYDAAWGAIINMRQKYQPKDVLGWILEKNLKVI
jgi:hypothetical protein